MKLNKKYNVAPGFESLFAHKSEEEALEHEARMIMARFLSEMEKVASEKKLKKADIAKAIGTSASFITQLYRGDKLINLTTLAKLQVAYDFTFEVKAKENSSNYQEEVEALSRNVRFTPPHSRPALWISGRKPDYAQNDIIDFPGKLNKTKIA